MFDVLNFPSYSFQIQEADRKKMIFDVVRKKFVVLTPEEWVRQHVLHHLIYDKTYSASLLAVETGIKFNGMIRRCDIVAYKNNEPYLLVECKAPHIVLTPEVVAQIARYQSVLKVPYLFISNGIRHLCLKRNESGRIEICEEIPPFHK